MEKEYTDKDKLESYRDLTLAQIEKFGPEDKLVMNLGEVTLELYRLEEAE